MAENVNGGAIPEIKIDWSVISSEDDFYRSMLPQLDAPEWHGRNLDALWDSIGVGSINKVEPPYRIVFVNSDSVSDSLAELARKVLLVCFDAAIVRPGIEVVIRASRTTSTAPARRQNGTRE